MIRAWRWLWATVPARWIRAGVLFALGAFAMWNVQRHVLRRTAENRLVQAATTGKAAVRHRKEAARIDQKLARTKVKAEKRIEALRQDGHESMAKAVESLNAF